MRIYNKQSLRSFRKELRNNATLEEQILWKKIRNDKLGVRFRRQFSIGYFIVDFYCPTHKLIIEIDGAQHLQNLEYDLERTYYFEDLGLKVLRFWNSEIHNDLNSVLEKIKNMLPLKE